MTLHDWHTTICKGDAVFLVGAGISSDPPACLPLAPALSRVLAASLTAQARLPATVARKVERLLSKARPEVLGDVLVEHVGGAALVPLRNVLQGTPNRWHSFLASAISAGCSVVTTNFDNLIEQACSTAMSYTRITTPKEAGEFAGSTTPVRRLLVKVHGTLGTGRHRRGESLTMALRQVARGMNPRMGSLLRRLLKDRPLIVVGYAGRDDFDIAPWMLTLDRAAPTLWIVHDEHRMTLVPVRGAARRWKPAGPALACAAAWTGSVAVYRGRTANLRKLLDLSKPPGPDPRRTRAASSQAQYHRDAYGSRRPASTAKAAQALAFALLQQRQPALAATVLRHTLTSNPISRPWRVRLEIGIATMMEKEGADLRAAEAYTEQVVEHAEALRSPMHLALALDQRGVVARRRGLYRDAERYYRRALRFAIRTRPAWLEIQIRSHRAIALFYLKKYARALREHRKVLAFERSIGDFRGVAMTLNNMGMELEWMRRYKAAIDVWNESIAMKELLGDPRGIAHTRHNLGHLYHRVRNYPAALREFQTSRGLREDMNDVHGVAQSLVGLGRVRLKMGAHRLAVRDARAALKAMQKCGDERGMRQARDLLKNCLESRLLKTPRVAAVNGRGARSY